MTKLILLTLALCLLAVVMAQGGRRQWRNDDSDDGEDYERGNNGRGKGRGRGGNVSVY